MTRAQSEDLGTVVKAQIRAQREGRQLPAGCSEKPAPEQSARVHKG